MRNWCLCLVLLAALAGTQWAVAGSPVPATAEQQAALDRMNAYRRLVGVAPLRLDPALSRAAVNHATYYVLNYGDPALSGLGLHDEQPGKPGFTGADIEARIRGQGYAGSWNESMSTLGDPPAAVDAFMAEVNHRLPIIDPLYTDAGYGGNATAPARVDVFTYGGQAPRPPPPTFVAYPADGMTGVPASYDGNETNAAFPGAHYPLGTAITLHYTGAGDLAAGQATLSGPDGAGLPVVSRVSYNFITHNTVVFAATAPLQPGQRYTARVTGSVAGTPFVRTWSFVTALAGQRPLPAPVAPLEAAFTRVWSQHDWPLSAGYVTRSWVWGPVPFDTRDEPYREGAGGQRRVQYFDKSRMEINDPAAPRSSLWYVTNGLLVVEMVSGRVQVGDNAFAPRAPAQEPVAGDPRPANPDAPSYAAMRGVTSLAGENAAPDRTGSLVTAALDAWGGTGTNAAAGAYGVRAGHYVPETRHNIADRFWAYLQQSGLVYGGGSLLSGPLYNWVYLTGYPISEPYWITAAIGGKPYPVLVQLFQRRVLTYTPGFDPAWQVQMGNVGQHYHAWRYGQ